MAKDDDWWGAAVIIGVIALGTYQCSKPDKTEEVPPVTSAIELPAAMATEAPPPQAPQLPVYTPPPLPSHNYADREGSIYYYVAAVSDEDRKRGVSGGNVTGYSYGGKNANGEHIVLRAGQTFTCSNPCRVIKVSNGDRLAYNGQSIISAVFEDAIRGKLKAIKISRPAPIPPPPEGYFIDEPPAEETVQDQQGPEPAEIPSDSKAD